jgi:NTE family protein
MSKAVVLGGGGPVGIGWEAGLLVGLAERGVDLSDADSVVGTSAGSVVGFTLAAGEDLSEAPNLVRSSADGAGRLPGAPPALDEALMRTLAQAAAHPDQADRLRAELGRLALEASPISEEQWLEMFSYFVGRAWPRSFRATAVDVSDGRFRAWDWQSGVDPARGIASSCAVPGIFPPVSIGPTRWMDGGVRDILNADLAAGSGVAVLLSCTLLEIPPELAPPGMPDIFASTRSLIDSLRRGGTSVEVITPGKAMLEVSGFGLALMDFTKVADAYQAGLDQGHAEAERIARAWSS